MPRENRRSALSAGSIVTEKSVIRNDPCSDFDAKTATEAAVTDEGITGGFQIEN
jgi:hypothetical protein